MRLQRLNSRSSSIALGGAAALVAAMALLPQQASAGAQVIRIEPFSAAVYVPCAADGAGEFVALNFTLTLVENQDDGEPAEIGIWSNVDGFGILTGDTYRGAVTSTAVPGSDTEYLTHIAMMGLGPNGAKFTLTRIGPLFQPPSEVIQVHCN